MSDTNQPTDPTSKPQSFTDLVGAVIAKNPREQLTGAVEKKSREIKGAIESRWGSNARAIIITGTAKRSEFSCQPSEFERSVAAQKADFLTKEVDLVANNYTSRPDMALDVGLISQTERHIQDLMNFPNSNIPGMSRSRVEALENISLMNDHISNGLHELNGYLQQGNDDMAEWVHDELIKACAEKQKINDTDRAEPTGDFGNAYSESEKRDQAMLSQNFRGAAEVIAAGSMGGALRTPKSSPPPSETGAIRYVKKPEVKPAGEPVSVATGEYLETWNDFLIPGLIPLSGARYMGLQMPMSWRGPLGYCQLSAFDEVITNPTPGFLSYFDSEGHEVTFKRPFNFLASDNAAYPHLSLKAPWLKQLELKDRRIIKKFYQYPDKIYRLQSIEDVNGNILVLHRDALGTLQRVETPDGLTLEFGNNHLRLRTGISLIGIDGSHQELARYNYDDKGRMVTADCAFGMSVRYEWHENKNLITRWHNKTARTETTFTYDDEGRVIHTATSGLWNNDRFEYDREQGITTYYPAGDEARAQKYAYDRNENITGETDALGGTVRYIYNKMGFRTATIDQNGHQSRTKYDLFGNIRQTTDAEGRDTIFGWGPYGELDIEIDPAGNVHKYENDQYGLTIGEKDAEGREVRYERNERGQITRIIAPNGAEEQRIYNQQGWLETAIDAKGGETRYSYDPFGRIASVTNPLGGITRYAYGARAGGFTTPTQVMRADGVIVGRSFDTEGALATVTDGEGRTWSYRHGAFDVLESVQDPDGGTLKLDYDSNGNLITVTNAAKRCYHLHRDAAERVVAEEDFDGRITRYERDACGRVTRMVKPDGAYLTYAYDKTGLIMQIAAFAANAQETDAPQDTVKLGYDACGRIIKAENNAALVRFKRDKTGTIVEENINGRRVKLLQDKNGQLIGRQLFSGRDQDGERQALHQLHYQRDIAGYLTKLMIGDHAPLAFHHDALGREVLRESRAGFRLQQSYDIVSQLTRQSAGIAIASLGSGLGGMMAAQNQGLDGHAGQQLERGYQWDKASSPLEINDNIWGATTYRYDKRGQIAETRFGKEGSESFAYDAASNLRGVSNSGKDTATGASGAGDAVGQLLNWKSTAGGVVQLARGANGETVKLKHDACGRVIERVVERKGFRRQLWRYEWDGFDRISACITPQGERWVFGYDPFGRRIHKIRTSAAQAAQKRVSSELTEAEKNRGAYYEEPKKQRFAEKDGQIIVGTQFMWHGDLLVEEADMLADGSADWQNATRWHYEEGGFRPLAKETPANDKGDSQLLYIVNDHLGTPQEMFSESGELVWSIRLSTWGTVRGVRKAVPPPANDDFEFIAPPPKTRGNLALKPVAEEAAYDCPIRFPGQWQDEETGLYYNRHRYYDPLAAQYTSPDPIGLEGGARPQGYVDCPNVFIDTLGLSQTFKTVPTDMLRRTHSIEGKSSSKRVRNIYENMKLNGFGDEPIIVVESGGRYYVVDGHHRLAAAKRAGVDANVKIVPPETIFNPRGYKNMQDILDSATTVGPDGLRGPGGKRW